MKERPSILITNDDGIQAPGIRHLSRALVDVADIFIVAPASEQSGVGLCISLRSQLTVSTVTWPDGAKSAWSVTGTPADCVKIGLGVLMERRPNLVVSGINRGANHGRSLLYSGTVGGAIEAVLQGVPGIAFSSYDLEDTEYEVFEPYIPKLVRYILENPLPTGTLLNVNFPRPLDQRTEYPVKLTRQGRQYWVGNPENENENTYSLGSKLSNCIENEESDTYWLRRSAITAAPIHVDELTDWHYIHTKKNEFEAIFG
jgi:5'-nucleotidase